uniref:PIPK domain-containing protein n=1 Tax=Romanomermis culicivorax TaxID=13658 RepID=A0A915LAF2_ROMCU
SFGNLLATLQVLVDKISRDAIFYDETELKNSVDSFEICMEKMFTEKLRLVDMVTKWNAALNEALVGLKKKRDAEESKTTLPVLNNQFSLAESGGQSSETTSLSDFTSPQIRQTLNSSSANEISMTCSPSNVPSDRKSLSKMLSSYILSSPFEPCEHYALYSGAVKSHILVNDKECGSIVAYSLNSDQYEAQRRLQVSRWLKCGPPFSVKHPAFVLERRSSEQELFAPTSSGVSYPSSFPPDTYSDLASPHIEIQFNDQTTKFYCKIYFAEHFRLLRRLIFDVDDTPGRCFEQKFITSLSRVENWTPKGGKSGAIFNRTVDKRFVLKQISRFELQSFQKFAPDYFDYVADAWTSKRPSALAKIFDGAPTVAVDQLLKKKGHNSSEQKKIFGAEIVLAISARCYRLYRVCLTNSQTSTDIKMDFIVMEYLFYGRNVDKVYDLKGSVRNRLAQLTPDVAIAQTSSKKAPQSLNFVNNGSKNVDDAVLLDVNLLKDVANTSFYLFPKAKSALNHALYNDTHFLAENHVMDYSLLCAFDRDNQDRLIVGIIDYMRTYTWDKRLESWVKSTVTINNQLPTVVSPEVYRERFVAIMDVYFPVAPDQWTGL